MIGRLQFGRQCLCAAQFTRWQQLSTFVPEMPVIRVPKYMEQGLGQTIYKEHEKVKKNMENRTKIKYNSKHVNKLLISSSGDKKLNHYYGHRYRLGQNNLPLISKEWTKRYALNQQMTFHEFDSNPSIMEYFKDEDKSFTSIGLDESIVSSIYGLVNKGRAISPSSVQFGVIPFILKNKNVIFSAETGSGKTIAYLAPLIQMIAEEKKNMASEAKFKRNKSPLALVILPSRELTQQVGGVAQELASSTDVGVATMIGGLPQNLTHTGLDIVVATIGMIEEHLHRGIYKLDRLNHIVLDEADTLLDDTFSSEVIDLLEKLNFNTKETLDPEDDKEPTNNHATQLICVSATMPTTLDSTIGSFVDLNEDVEKITTKNLHTLHPNVKHIFHRLIKFDRDPKLIELLKEDQQKRKCTMIFGNRTEMANWIYHFLNENEIPCLRLTKDMSEEERFHSFKMFNNGECDVLVSTDLGSRGLDTIRVNHVINFDCPHYVSDYIHRAGRTGRLGSVGLGKVTTFVSFKPDIFMLQSLERSIRLGVEIESPNANIKNQIRSRREEKKEKMQRNEH